MSKFVILFITTLFTLITYSQVNTEKEIKELSTYTDLIVELREKKKNAKSSYFLPIPFRKNKEEYEEELQKLLSSLDEVLYEYEYIEITQHIKDLNNKIVDRGESIKKLKEDKFFAPTPNEARWYQSSKEDVSKKIKKEQEEISDLKANISRAENKLIEYMKSQGVRTTKNAIRKLTSSVDVDQFANQLSTFNYIKDINREIGALLKENPDAAVRYYGTYLVMSGFLGYILKSSIEPYNKEYFPKIANLMEEQKETIKFSKKLLRKTRQKDQKEILQRNIEVNEFNLWVCGKYVNYLKGQRARLISRYEENLLNFDVIFSSYLTAKNSQEVLSLIQNAENQFLHIMQIKLPEIIPFENKLIEAKWIEISAQISNAR